MPHAFLPDISNLKASRRNTSQPLWHDAIQMIHRRNDVGTKGQFRAEEKISQKKHCDSALDF